ncbi:hypothetical protein Tco_1325136 [Tanacetum coccineum]
MSPSSSLHHHHLVTPVTTPTPRTTATIIVIIITIASSSQPHHLHPAVMPPSPPLSHPHHQRARFGITKHQGCVWQQEPPQGWVQLEFNTQKGAFGSGFSTE